MNLLKEFKTFAAERGYKHFEEALSHIAFLRTFEDKSLKCRKSLQPHSSPYYAKWIGRLPCIGCAQKIGVSARVFSSVGELLSLDASREDTTYHCLPICYACIGRPEVLLAIKIRYLEIVLSLLTTYLRCVEGR